MMPSRRPDHTPSRYSLSPHAANQAAMKGWQHHEILAAANDPHTTYANGRYPGQMRHIRGDIVAVVDPDRKKVVTVYKNVEETALRSDQRDRDAKSYGRRRGRA